MPFVLGDCSAICLIHPDDHIHYACICWLSLVVGFDNSLRILTMWCALREVVVTEEVDIATRRKGILAHYGSAKTYEEEHTRHPEKDDKLKQHKRMLCGEERNVFDVFEGPKDAWVTEVTHHVKIHKVTHQCRSTSSASITQEVEAYKKRIEHHWNADVLAGLPKLIFDADLQLRKEKLLADGATVAGTQVEKDREEDEEQEKIRQQLLAAENANRGGPAPTPSRHGKKRKTMSGQLGDSKFEVEYKEIALRLESFYNTIELSGKVTWGHGNTCYRHTQKIEKASDLCHKGKPFNLENNYCRMIMQMKTFDDFSKSLKEFKPATPVPTKAADVLQHFDILQEYTIQQGAWIPEGEFEFNEASLSAGLMAISSVYVKLRAKVDEGISKFAGSISSAIILDKKDLPDTGEYADLPESALAIGESLTGALEHFFSDMIDYSVATSLDLDGMLMLLRKASLAVRRALTNVFKAECDEDGSVYLLESCEEESYAWQCMDWISKLSELPKEHLDDMVDFYTLNQHLKIIQLFGQSVGEQAVNRLKLAQTCQVKSTGTSDSLNKIGTDATLWSTQATTLMSQSWSILEKEKLTIRAHAQDLHGGLEVLSLEVKAQHATTMTSYATAVTTVIFKSCSHLGALCAAFLDQVTKNNTAKDADCVVAFGDECDKFKEICEVWNADHHVPIVLKDVMPNTFRTKSIPEYCEHMIRAVKAPAQLMWACGVHTTISSSDAKEELKSGFKKCLAGGKEINKRSISAMDQFFACAPNFIHQSENDMRMKGFLEHAEIDHVAQKLQETIDAAITPAFREITTDLNTQLNKSSFTQFPAVKRHTTGNDKYKLKFEELTKDQLRDITKYTRDIAIENLCMQIMKAHRAEDELCTTKVTTGIDKVMEAVTVAYHEIIRLMGNDEKANVANLERAVAELRKVEAPLKELKDVYNLFVGPTPPEALRDQERHARTNARNDVAKLAAFLNTKAVKKILTYLVQIIQVGQRQAEDLLPAEWKTKMNQKPILESWAQHHITPEEKHEPRVKAIDQVNPPVVEIGEFLKACEKAFEQIISTAIKQAVYDVEKASIFSHCMRSVCMSLKSSTSNRCADAAHCVVDAAQSVPWFSGLLRQQLH